MNEKELRHALDATADRRRIATESLADRASTDFEIEGDRAQREHGIPSGLHEIRHIGEYQNSVQELLDDAVTAELEAGTERELVAAALDVNHHATSVADDLVDEFDLGLCPDGCDCDGPDEVPEPDQWTETVGFTKDPPADWKLLAIFAAPLILFIAWPFIAPSFLRYPEWFGLEADVGGMMLAAALGSLTLFGTTILCRFWSSEHKPARSGARTARAALTWLMAASLLVLPWHFALPGTIEESHSVPVTVSEGRSEPVDGLGWCEEVTTGGAKACKGRDGVREIVRQLMDRQRLAAEPADETTDISSSDDAKAQIRTTTKPSMSATLRGLGAERFTDVVTIGPAPGAESEGAK